MIRLILQDGDPILCAPCAQVVFGPELSDIIEDMHQTMEAAGGAGLAANQIGISIQLFVMGKAAYCNPKIISQNNIGWKTERCLSAPTISCNVLRFENIVLEWQTPDAMFCRKAFQGFEAQIIQHEIEHLEGRMITNYMDTKPKPFAL